jgi:hypothetical protein
MSDETPTVVEALLAVMRDVKSIAKKDLNSHFNFNFRGIDTVLDVLGPVLRTHGVLPVPKLRTIHLPDTVGGKANRVVVEVAYTFYGPRGDSIEAVVPGEAQDGQDKASSKAMSVAFRTVLLQMFAIPTGERDPHAGPVVSTKLARLREEAKKIMAAKEWDAERMAGEYGIWSSGGEIGAADEQDLEKFLATLRPKQTMRRGQ